MTPAQMLGRVRLKNGWSQDRLATELKVSQATISRIERGEIENLDCRILAWLRENSWLKDDPPIPLRLANQ